MTQSQLHVQNIHLLAMFSAFFRPGGVLGLFLFLEIMFVCVYSSVTLFSCLNFTNFLMRNVFIFRLIMSFSIAVISFWMLGTLSLLHTLFSTLISASYIDFSGLLIAFPLRYTVSSEYDNSGNKHENVVRQVLISLHFILSGICPLDHIPIFLPHCLNEEALGPVRCQESNLEQSDLNSHVPLNTLRRAAIKILLRASSLNPAPCSVRVRVRVRVLTFVSSATSTSY